ncbi:MAG: PD-(D/E)XK motif protein [Gemmatimonadota bacterium]
MSTGANHPLADANWISIFDSLALPSTSAGTRAFSARRVGGHHVAKDADGNPALLIRVAADGRPRSPVPVRLANLRVEHSLHCRVSGDNAVGDEVLTAVQCSTSDRQLHEYFLKAMQGVTASLPHPARQRDVDELVDGLVALFQAMREPPSATVHGLWAELFLIATSLNPGRLLEAWHNEPSNRYDFDLNDERLDVKSSIDRTRRHYFSLEQVQPPVGINAYIVSVFVERSSDGLSLGELWDSVRTLASHNPSLVLKVEHVCTKTLGVSWFEARSLRFDEAVAVESIAIYDAMVIPSVPRSLPVEVCEVRFRSDLTASPTIRTSTDPASILSAIAQQ